MTLWLTGLTIIMTSLFSKGQTININGQIRDAETGVPIQAAMEVLINLATGARLDSTQSDGNGFYDLTYFWVGLEDEASVFLNKDREYKIIAFDNQGRMLFEKSEFMTRGAYEFNISGGQAGINYITITDGEISKTYKGLQVSSTGRPLDIQVSQITTTPQLKSTLDDILTEGDLAKLESSAANYYTTDTTFTLQANQTINQNLEKMPTVYDYNLIALDHKDTATANVAINIQWSDGVTTTHYGQNGLVNIHRETTHDLSDTIFITNADTTIYSPLMWARKQSNPLDEANLFQNPAVPFQPVEPAPALLSTLPDTANLFMLVKQVPDPLNPGQYIRTDSETFLAFFLGSSPWVTVRYTYAPQVIDSIDNFRIKRVETATGYGDLVSQEQFDQMCTQQDSSFALLRSPYGLYWAPPIRTENVDNPATNQRYLAAQARGFDQAMKTLYSNNLGTPGIYAVIPTNLHTIIVNGQPSIRIKGGYAKVQLDALPEVIREETVGNLMNGDDVNGGNSGPYLVGPNGENTEFAKVAAYEIYGLNPGSYALVE